MNGRFNHQNFRFWSADNPNWTREVKCQDAEKVNVWAGIYKHSIIGPFFIDGNINGENYLDLLEKDAQHCWRQQKEMTAFSCRMGRQHTSLHFQSELGSTKTFHELGLAEQDRFHSQHAAQTSPLLTSSFGDLSRTKSSR